MSSWPGDAAAASSGFAASSAGWLSCKGDSSRIFCIISTNRPDIGRLDQSGLAVIWKKMSTPAPRFAAVTSGVPSMSRAQTLASRGMAEGSERTCWATVTSAGMASPLNGESCSKGAGFCGEAQVIVPPSERPPSRNGAGRSKSPPCSSRGPAKRISIPPFSTKALSRARALPARRPTSLKIMIDGEAATRSAVACSRLAVRARLTSAKGVSARSR